MNAFYEREIELVMIKELQDSIWAKQATYLRENTGESVVKCLDIFQHEGKHYAVYEYITLSLFELQANPLFDDLSLASVMGQILPSLAKLEAKGLEHGQLTTSNILIDLHGTVKLWGYEHLQDRSGHSRNISDLEAIVSRLMQGYINNEGGTPKIDDKGRWPAKSHAIRFFSAMQDAQTISHLKDDPLLKLPWRKFHLQKIANLTNIWSFRVHEE
ncbi:hypothetical protein V2G26_007203 [Clonostachys chloroleuca]